MTVYENLEMGASTRPREPEFDHDLARVLILFAAGRGAAAPDPRYLAGGEQQMVAIGALMARPKLLCMDEPSMGLSPACVEQVFDIIRTINRQGVTIFIVEQNANMALSIADRAYVLQTGRFVLSGPEDELRENELIRQPIWASSKWPKSRHLLSNNIHIEAPLDQPYGGDRDNA